MASQQIRGGCNTIKVKVAVKRPPEAQPLRCQTRWFKDGIKRRLGELNAIRKNLAAATLLNRHYIIHITHARDLLQDITARVHQASPETLELHRRLDALRVEDSDAVAQEKELEIQRERLLATLYPDDDETLFSVDNGHLEKQILAAKQRQVVLQNYVQSARSSSVQEGEVKPSMAPLRFDRELSDSHVLKLMVNAQSKLSQLRDKKLCTEGNDTSPLGEALQIKIAAAEARLLKAKEELQLRSALLVAARTHLHELECRVLASLGDACVLPAST